VGAWIETLLHDSTGTSNRVAPRVGAWIETFLRENLGLELNSRTPRGCVD